MNRILNLFVVVAIGFSTSVFATGLSSKLKTQIERKLRNTYSGYSMASSIRIEDDEIFSYYGGKGVSHTTKFLLASVTKSINASVFAKYMERGLLNEDEPIWDYLPESFKSRVSDDRWKTVEIRNLIHHTSGIEDYLNHINLGGFLSTPHTPEEILLRVSKKIRFDPDAKLEYSNTNYLIMAMILEKVSGMTFEEVISEEVTGPLQMQNSGNLKAYGGGVRGRSVGIHPINFKGIGDIYSTTDDLMLFLGALDTPGYLSAPWLEKIFQYDPKCGRNGPGDRCKRYGFGFSIRDGLINGYTMVVHQGHFNRVSNVVAKVLGTKLNLVILSDKRSVEGEDVATELLSWIANELGMQKN